MIDFGNFWCLPESLAPTVLRTCFAGKLDPRQQASREVRQGVAVIDIDGVLTRSGFFFTTGYDLIRERIDAAAADPDVGAILLNIDSPGGQVAGCQELARHIAQLAKSVPMAAYTNGLMASAAFWLGSATGRIFTAPTAQIGSVGVILTLWNEREALRQAGLDVRVISAGRMKAAGNPYSELSDEDAEYFQRQAAGIHAEFRQDVANWLGLDLGSADSWGDGQIFLGNEAAGMDAPLAQMVDGLDAVIEILAKEIKMDRETLMAQAPELVEALLEEGRSQASAVEREIAKDERAAMLACVKKLVGPAAFARAEAFFAACEEQAFTPDQMMAVADMVASAQTPSQTPAQPEQEKAEVPQPDTAGLKALAEATPAPVAADPAATPQAKDFLALVADYVRTHGVSRAEAMRAVATKNPEAHADWLDRVNAKPGQSPKEK